MKCADKKELILFYYKECDPKRFDEIGKHLSQCVLCGDTFKEIAASLLQLGTKKVVLSDEEIHTMLSRFHQRRKASSSKEYAVRFIEPFFAVFQTRAWRPQLIGAALVLLLFFFLFPSTRQKNRALKQEFAILEIQMELSLEDESPSLFDLYEEAPDASSGEISSAALIHHA